VSRRKRPEPKLPYTAADLPQPEEGRKLLTAEQQVERNRMFVEMRLRGVSIDRTAQTFGLHRDTVLRAMREFRKSNPTLRTQDPIDIVDEMLLGYQADLEELATISATAKSDNARIGAVNSRMVARDRIIALLQSTGVLPHDLGNLKIEIDVRYIAQTLVAVLNKHHVDEGIQRELLEALRGGSTQGELPPGIVVTEAE
jgi:hypothetical protein